ncbi:hypothetical protein GCM10020295_00700 [Streptomyces cinereospinus]
MLKKQCGAAPAWGAAPHSVCPRAGVLTALADQSAGAAKGDDDAVGRSWPGCPTAGMVVGQLLGWVVLGRGWPRRWTVVTVSVLVRLPFLSMPKWPLAPATALLRSAYSSFLTA